MSSNASVAIGPPMSPDEEAAHRQRLLEQAADEAEAAAETIQAKLDGMAESLRTAKAEAKRARAAATKGAKEANE